MGRTEVVTLTNMCMIYDDDGNVLVQDKIDPDWKGITFPGGHVEKGESFVDSVIREIKEELGIDIKVKKLMYKLNTYMRMQYVFLGEYVSRNTSELEKVKNMKKRITRNMVNIFHK